MNSHIWDSWADETGSIGKAYGYQIGHAYSCKSVTEEGLQEVFPDGEWTDFRYLRKDHPETVYAQKYKRPDGSSIIYMDQINKVLYDLKRTPYSRRILTNIYNFQDLDEMNLHPCAYSVTFNVTKEPGQDKLTLNTILNQRSQDVLAANNWNVVQYAMLTMMIAQVCDMIPGEFVHMIADAHIYDRHVDIIKELISRKPLPAPKVTLSPDITNFYDFTTKDILIENYETYGQIRNIPIAV